MDRPSIVFIGSGNVATHLARALDKVADVTQVVSANPGHARRLASELSHCRATELHDIDTAADFYIIAVNDDAIARVSASMPAVSGIVAHTSGSTPMQAIATRCSGHGVFYPLQTFSRGSVVDVGSVPFFIEGSDAGTAGRLTGLASLISRHVYAADSGQRATLHIAAVFASNFFNHLLVEAQTILGRDGYPIEVLHPLLQATLDKAMAIGPENAQTGPAARGDLNVIASHMARLSGTSREIYNLMSRAIADARGANS